MARKTQRTHAPRLAREDRIDAIRIAARDLFCEQMHQSHPQYGFATHKGYGTAEHLAALKEHGASPWHRRSFAPVRENLR